MRSHVLDLAAATLAQARSLILRLSAQAENLTYRRTRSSGLASATGCGVSRSTSSNIVELPEAIQGPACDGTADLSAGGIRWDCCEVHERFPLTDRQLRGVIPSNGNFPQGGRARHHDRPLLRGLSSRSQRGCRLHRVRSSRCCRSTARFGWSISFAMITRGPSKRCRHGIVP